MNNFRFKITVEDMAGNHPEPLVFEVASHEDIISIAERVKQRGDFSAEEAPAFAIGLKLLGGTMLKNRDMPLFADFQPHFGNFMKQLKKPRP